MSDPTADPMTTAISVGVTAASMAFPVLVPFAPLVTALYAAWHAHRNATGQDPTEAELIAAIAPGNQEIKDLWAAWKPSGR